MGYETEYERALRYERVDQRDLATWADQLTKGAYLDPKTNRTVPEDHTVNAFQDWLDERDHPLGDVLRDREFIQIPHGGSYAHAEPGEVVATPFLLNDSPYPDFVTYHMHTPHGVLNIGANHDPAATPALHKRLQEHGTRIDHFC